MRLEGGRQEGNKNQYLSTSPLLYSPRHRGTARMYFLTNTLAVEPLQRKERRGRVGEEGQERVGVWQLSWKKVGYGLIFPEWNFDPFFKIKLKIRRKFSSTVADFLSTLSWASKSRSTDAVVVDAAADVADVSRSRRRCRGLWADSDATAAMISMSGSCAAFEKYFGTRKHDHSGHVPRNPLNEMSFVFILGNFFHRKWLPFKSNRSQHYSKRSRVSES